ncbi:MAG: hypothetical protein ABEI13_02190 [Candidatus Paceibacteria bacterium]
MKTYPVDLNQAVAEWPQWIVLRFYTRNPRSLIPCNYIWNQIPYKSPCPRIRYKGGNSEHTNRKRKYSHPSSDKKEVFPYGAVSVKDLASWLRVNKFFLVYANGESIQDHWPGGKICSFYRLNFWYKHEPLGPPLSGYKYQLQSYVSDELLAKYDWKVRLFCNPSHVSLNFDSHPETPSLHTAIKFIGEKHSFFNKEELQAVA